MSNFVGIGVYPKGGKRAGIVFRKNNILYRITTVERADQFIGKMYNYARDLKRNIEEPEFIVELLSPRGKSHAMEIALRDDNVELRVYEMIDGCAKLCFKWIGLRDELLLLLANFSVMMVVLRF